MVAVLGAISTWVAPVSAEPDARALYTEHCASCHGAKRLGGSGPALLPRNLERLSRSEAAQVIRQGRPATQMPAFGERLSDEQIAALVEHVYSEPAVSTQWDRQAIRASHRVLNAPGSLPDEPRFDADPLNLFVVVEKGSHHVTILDGDRFDPIHRFESRPDLHGGPKFSPEGRYVYFASRNGWVTKYDLYGLRPVAEVRAGLNTRNIAVSADGRYVAVGNYLPHTVVVLSGDDLAPVEIIAVRGREGRSSRVSAVYTAPPRESFVVALKDVKEVWEIPYAEDADALPIYKGLMHDYRRESGEVPPIDHSDFPIRRIAVPDYLDDFFFDPGYRHLIGASRSGGASVVNLTVGRVIAELDIPGFPHLGSGITWRSQGRPVLATPNLEAGTVSIVDMRDWRVIERIDTLGPGFFMRSHENSPFAWTGVFFGPHRDALHVIDKQSLEIVRTLRPTPGKTAAHVEFTRDGRYALVSIWEPAPHGAIVVYDAKTLEEIKRIPMDKPSGKYNVYNKINLSTGTSH